MYHGKQFFGCGTDFTPVYLVNGGMCQPAGGGASASEGWWVCLGGEGSAWGMGGLHLGQVYMWVEFASGDLANYKSTKVDSTHSSGMLFCLVNIALIFALDFKLHRNDWSTKRCWLF